MLDKEKGIDAVTVSTPDHTHAVASLAAMVRGKHVYCQKPLTHTIHEARVMTRAASHYKVITQMGNQAHAGRTDSSRCGTGTRGVSSDPCAKFTAGRIVLYGHKAKRPWTNESSSPTRPNQPTSIGTYGLDQPCRVTSTHALCHPNGAAGGTSVPELGDMACHIMDMPYWALELGSLNMSKPNQVD